MTVPGPSKKSGLRGLAVDTRPLKILEFRRLWIGQAVAVVGSQLSVVAVQQQIFDITGSSAWVGIASAVALVPLIAFGLFGGAIADTYDRRRILLITSVGMAVATLGLWAHALSGLESVWVIMGMLALQQAMFAVNSPTRTALIPRLVPVEMVASANALNMTVFSLGVILGPMLAGLLLPHLGLSWLFFFDFLSFLAILYAVFKLPPMPRLGPPLKDRASVREGLRFLRTRDVLLMTFVVDLIAMIFGLPRALFPQMAEQTFGGAPGGGLELGLLNIGMAIGSMIGGLTGGWIQRIHRQGIAIVAAIVLWGLSMVGLGLTNLLWLAVLFLAIGGWSDLVSAVYRSTMLQVAVSDEMRGRMQGVFLVVVAGGPRVADLLHGLAAGWSTTAVAITGGGILVVIGVLAAAAIRPALIHYDSRELPESP